MGDQRRDCRERSPIGQRVDEPGEMEGMIVDAGLRERGDVAGRRGAYPKPLVAQRKQKRDAKGMVFSSNAEQVRSHVGILICCWFGSIGIRNVLGMVISPLPTATATSHARLSTRRSDRKAESIRTRQQARRSALHNVR